MVKLTFEKKQLFKLDIMLSIILEWENAVLAELKRTEILLYQIITQGNKREEEIELIILHNSQIVSRDFISKFLDKILLKVEGFSDSKFHFKIEDVKDAHYYELKNRGVQIATGDVLIIVDSDVIPDSNWMESLINSHMLYPEALIGGFTCVDYSDFMGKSFALGWFFSIPKNQVGLIKSNHINANNYIAKRELLLANSYNDMSEGMTRGACEILWKSLNNKGVSIYKNLEAKATHPYPNGINHFFNRGLAEGRDSFLLIKETGKGNAGSIFQLFKEYALRCKKVVKNTVSEKKHVGLKSWQIPFALGVMLSYYQLYLMGGLITRFFPTYSRSNWQI